MISTECDKDVISDDVIHIITEYYPRDLHLNVVMINTSNCVFS